MNKNNTELINYIESIGFIRDIDDNIWYTKDYQKRISPQFFNNCFSHVFYNSGGFNNPQSFKNVDELKELMNNTENKVA